MKEAGIKRLDIISLALLAACGLLLAWKAWAVWRLNVNWDEFYFLSHIHALNRGDLAIPYQTAYTQAFRWLPGIDGGEMAQMHVARLVMLALLALAAVQIFRLAVRWVSAPAAAAAALAFLCVSYVLRHGGSFRSDSMLLPVLLGVLLLLTQANASRRTDLAAGVLCGVGLALNVKFALFAPLLVACLATASNGAATVREWLRALWLRCVPIGIATLITAAILLGLHQSTIQEPDVETAATFADRTLSKTLLENGFVPRLRFLQKTLLEDWLVWGLLTAGLVLSLARKHWNIAVMALALVPVLFYRNAYPYFYIVMLAPAMVLVAFSMEQLRLRREWLVAAAGGLLLVVVILKLPAASADGQAKQQTVIEAVHTVFPHPINYMDHSGMIASFRKVNFFMSTWGVEDYRRKGQPFVAKVLRDHRPPMLLVNLRSLNPNQAHGLWLLGEDRELLKRYYQPYWWPIMVAGARATLASGEVQQVSLPFPGAYRLEVSEPVSVDGVQRQPGEVIEFNGTAVSLARRTDAPPGELTLRLLWAAARPPPAASPVIGPYYEEL